VIPKATAGAQLNSPTRAPSWATNGSGRWSRISWLTHGSKGMVSDQTRPEAANSQPIGFGGRRRPQDQPDTGMTSGNTSTNAAPSSQHPRSQRPREAQSDHKPAAQKPNVISHNGQATRILVPARMLTTPLLKPRTSTTRRRSQATGTKAL
jgi:hypothetical protein